MSSGLPIPSVPTTRALPTSTDYLLLGRQTPAGDAKKLANDYVLTLDTRAVLKAQDVTDVTTGTTVTLLGLVTVGDGLGGTFYYDSTSTATPDDTTVIQPTVGSGRWLVASASSVSNPYFYPTTRVIPQDGDYIGVGFAAGVARGQANCFLCREATLTDLRAVPVTNVADNTTVVVLGSASPGDGYGGHYYYNSTSTATDDGYNVIAPTVGSGRWLLSVSPSGAGFEVINTTTSWYVNAVTGSDTTGTGTAIAPYATIDRALRRLSAAVVNAPLTIDIANGNYTPLSGVMLTVSVISVGASGSITFAKNAAASIGSVRLRMQLIFFCTAVIKNVTVGALNAKGTGNLSLDTEIRIMPKTEWNPGATYVRALQAGGGILAIRNMTISVESMTDTTFSVLNATDGGFITYGSAGLVFAAVGGTVTLSTTDAFSAFAYIDAGATMAFTGLVPTTTGTWVGKRYATAGQIRIFGGSSTTLPGNTAGTTAGAGQYLTS